jgi:tetraacyldisaccharide-1-P 4'-kinase
VANSLAFIRTLAEFKVMVRHSYSLKDHYPYTPEKLKAILEDAKLRGLQYLVTTQKDEVKLPREMDLDIPILVLEIKWEVTGGKNHWDKVMKNISLASHS